MVFDLPIDHEGRYIAPPSSDTFTGLACVVGLREPVTARPPGQERSTFWVHVATGSAAPESASQVSFCRTGSRVSNPAPGDISQAARTAVLSRLARFFYLTSVQTSCQ